MKPSELKALAEMFARSLKETQPDTLIVDVSPVMAQAIAEGVALAMHAQPPPAVTVNVEQPENVIHFRMPTVAKKIIRDENNVIIGTLEAPVGELGEGQE